MCLSLCTRQLIVPKKLHKDFFASASMLFEAFGFRYIGPVDGHSIPDLVTALEHAKDQDVPVLIHAATVKGKGFKPAESDPVKWHGVSPFNRGNGEFRAVKKTTPSPPSYTSVFANSLIKVADEDPNVIGITAAMPSGTGLDKFESAHPDKCFDVGICEQHAVTFAAGLACEGKKPVCAIYSTFLQRGYDQVVHDVCIQNLPVVFAMDRSGVVGNDGETHQGVFDIAFLRTLPNMVIMAAKDENELQHMVYTACKHDGPIAIRYPRGNGLGVKMDQEFTELEIGKSEVLSRGEDILFLSLGTMTNYAEQVAEKLSNELGLTSTVVNSRFVKPLDQKLLLEEIPKHRLICTIEDHALQGGFGSAVLEFAHDMNLSLQMPLQRFGVKDQYVTHASQAEQHAMHGYDPESIYLFISEALGSRKLAAAV